jgi:hypothetical protein
MRPERGGGARRLVGLIGLGCLLGAATAATSAAHASAGSAAGTTLALAANASAAKSCSGTEGREQVEGGRTSSHYGVRGDVYVNTRATIDEYGYGFVRSLTLIADSKDWVELGWSAHYEGTTSPQVFSEVDINGSRDEYNSGISPNYDTDHFFRIDNKGGVKIFRLYYDGNFLIYTPTLTFNQAPPLGNSERHYSCESLYTHMYNLNDLTNTIDNGGTWETWDGWNGCYNTSGTSPAPYYLHRDSDTEFHVNTDSVSALC